ncbi:ribonuclease H-like domain-containing protein [Desulfococcus sp.]|uniref:ribonuclease H-like domain-containing protein n=1 Tax=Desulfococcus sp. TaxID=2025834 RepID=UPI0035935971
MLQNTFQHIPGIGPKTERRLWDSGIPDWRSAGDLPTSRLPLKQADVFLRCLDESARALEDGNPRFFTDLMPAGLHWRLFPEFRRCIAYLDIETTGMDVWGSEITTIALYDGREVKTYVQGRNLEAFIDDIEASHLIVTYNGKVFDVPFIERYFRVRLNHSHIDLRHVLKRLGYGGGLKACERALGIDRGSLHGVDGFFAVLLWHDYIRNGNPRALETLLAYNIEDVVNLETLMVTAYNLNIRGTPYEASHKLAPPSMPHLPFQPDPLTIAQVRRSMFSGAMPFG